MQFQPKSEKEIQEAMLWPKGEYDFEVLKAERAVSGPNSKQPGTQFIKLTLRLFNSDGGSRMQNAILHPAMEAQLRHFCDECDIIEKYDAGTLDAHDCEGLSGKLQLKVKDAEGNFPAKNEVSDWGVKKTPEAKAKKPAPTVVPTQDNSDIPF